MTKLTDTQADALIALYKAVAYGGNTINGSLPNSPGMMMTKVKEPLASALTVVMSAFEKCKAQGL